MSIFKKCKVLLLPTNEKAPGIVMLKKSTNKLVTDFHSTRNTTDHFAQELYVLSDDEIKEGDWFIIIPDGINPILEPNFNTFILKCNRISEDIIFYGNDDYKSNTRVVRKIIATTNSSLKLTRCGNCNELGGKCKYEPKRCFDLHQPSQSFIEYFIEQYNLGNIITDVMVEYEKINERNPTLSKYNTIANAGGFDLQLKINSDNTINIKLFKNSWNRDEVIRLCFLSYNLRSMDKQVRSTFEMNKWIEENL